jgi:hypothetical protein
MKTLVFSSRVVLDGFPAGFSGSFKMLHLETGQLYNYRVHIPRHVYVGTQVKGIGSQAEDLKWWEYMFYALTVFIDEYNAEYGCLPADTNKYQDRRPYTSERETFGKKIYFLVERSKRRSLEEKQLILIDNSDVVPHQ